MKNMEEIAYWVDTGRPPCTYTLAKLLKAKGITIQNEAFKSRFKHHRSISSDTFDKPSPKKRKKKVSFLDEASADLLPKQYVFFQSTANSTLLNKMSNQLNNKSKAISTNCSKTVNKIKTSLNNQSPHNKISPGTSNRNIFMNHETIILESSSDGTENDFNVNSNVHNVNKVRELKPKPINCNNKSPKLAKRIAEGDECDDYSDVSGLTASYIRSTKVNRKAKPTRSTRPRTCKKVQPYYAESLVTLNASGAPSTSKQNTQTLCYNKATVANLNPQKSDVLDSSTASSHNILNIITCNNRNSTAKAKHSKINKSTSTTNISRSNNKRNSVVNSNTTKTEKIVKNCAAYISNHINDDSEPDKDNRTNKLTHSVKKNNISTRNTVKNNVKIPASECKRLTRSLRRDALNNTRHSASSVNRTRDQSGYSACFSESDEDVPLAKKKYFP